MCSRFELKTSTAKVIETFGLDDLPEELESLLDSDEIRPTDKTLLITKDKTANPKRWGLQVGWQKAPVINARIETIQNKPTFHPLLENRCLIPASAYYEWQKIDGGKRKTRLSDQKSELLSFAGLYEDDRFVILTKPPSADIAHIHNRMPLTLNAQGAAQWLEGNFNLHRETPGTLYSSPFGIQAEQSEITSQLNLF